MKVLTNAALAATLCLGFGATSFADGEVAQAGKDGKTKKKASYHCEVQKDGEHTDLPEVKDRESCKKQGGKWQKSHDKGPDDHGDSHEGHTDWHDEHVDDADHKD